MSKADTGTDEISGHVATASRGVWRKPIRKHAFHRALKRQEYWAILEQNMKHLQNSLAKTMYREFILQDNPFLGLLAQLEVSKLDKS